MNGVLALVQFYCAWQCLDWNGMNERWPETGPGDYCCGVSHVVLKLAARGVVPKWLRGRIANALFAGSIPADASKNNKTRAVMARVFCFKLESSA